MPLAVKATYKTAKDNSRRLARTENQYAASMEAACRLMISIGKDVWIYRQALEGWKSRQRSTSAD